MKFLANPVVGPGVVWPGGGVSGASVEADFGVVAKIQFTLAVANAAATATSRLLAQQSGAAATGRQADENEFDQYLVTAIPSVGSILFVFTALAGHMLQGKSKFIYLFV